MYRSGFKLENVRRNVPSRFEKNTTNRPIAIKGIKMIVEKIINKIFNISTPVLLFFDKEEEYKEEILAINDSRFKVLVVNDNYFKIEYELEILYPNEKVLSYHPFEKPTG